MLSGNPSPSLHSVKRAPIWLSGPVTRRIGLRRRDASRERRSEPMSGEEAEQEAGGRTGVAAVESSAGRLKSAAPRDGDHSVGPKRADPRPQLSEHPRRGAGIERSQGSTYMA